MKIKILVVSLFIIASTHIISASEGDLLPQSTMEGQTISSQLSSPSTDVSDTLLPALSNTQAINITKPQEDLSHEGLTSAPQSKEFIQLFNILNLLRTNKATLPMQPAITTSELAARKEPGTTSLPDFDRKNNNTEAPQAVRDELAHQIFSSDIQGKGTFSIIKPDDTMPLQIPATAPNQGTGAVRLTSTSVTNGWKADFNKLSRTDPDDISHQSLTTELQGKGVVTIFAASDTTDNQPISAQQYSAKGTTPPGPIQKNSQTLVAQAGTDDLSHQALATAIKDKDRFYFIKTGGAVPILDKTFRNFLDYGASVSVGAGNKINENLSLSVSLGIVLLTGDWSIGGTRQTLEIAAEEWAPGRYNDPGQTTIIVEDLPEENLGTGYHSEGEAVITSAESLKRIDVHTDLYLFPITVNALYKFHPIGKITPYTGGGLGFCVATRDSDSRALKSKFFNGPEYGIRLNNSQTRNGMLLNFLGGLIIPIYKNMTFIAEANMTYFDLKTFDPILEVSFNRPQNPSNLGGNDVSTWSYEDPMRIGVFSQEFVGNLFIGLVMPF